MFIITGASGYKFTALSAKFNKEKIDNVGIDRLDPPIIKSNSNL